MARQFDVTFRRPSGVVFRLRMDGHTRGIAERRARAWLRSQRENIRRIVTVSVEFVRTREDAAAR